MSKISLQNKQNLIFLTGFMGSGKSTLAPILAQKLGYNFIDIDEEIEKSTGKSINEIFMESGETGFRKIEQSLLQNASKQSECVISLGGGTITQVENLQLIKSNGILIYLKTNVDSIIERVKQKTDRPLLLDIHGEVLSEEDLRNRILKLLEQREPFYQQADLIIQTYNRTIASTVEEILQWIHSLQK